MICRPTGSPFARHLAGLDLGDHALVIANRQRQVAHAHALEDARVADTGAHLLLRGLAVPASAAFTLHVVPVGLQQAGARKGFGSFMQVTGTPSKQPEAHIRNVCDVGHRLLRPFLLNAPAEHDLAQHLCCASCACSFAGRAGGMLQKRCESVQCHEGAGARTPRIGSGDLKQQG